MSTGKVLLGVLAGVAAGALLGILFAPDKGASTRKKILDKGDAYADDLEEKFNDFIESISRKYESVMDDAADKVSGIKSKVDKAAAKAENLAKDQDAMSGV